MSSAGTPAEDRLSEVAHRVREHIVRMCAGREGGHLGGSMSLVEILIALYFDVMRIDPGKPDSADRDVLLLSKGHGGIALYAVLAERGFFPVDELADYGQAGSRLSAHPAPSVPGVEVHTGSLGHGLPLGVGYALAARIAGLDRRCFVILGDGELQEGSVWEAAMSAGSLGLDRLTAIVDRNGLQITGGTEDVVRLEPLAERWRSFGWAVTEVDGHDLAELLTLLRPATEVPSTTGVPPTTGVPQESGVPLASGSRQPTVVIARTVKGNGLPFVAGQPRSHYARLGDAQTQRALAVLRRTSQGRSQSGPTQGSAAG